MKAELTKGEKKELQTILSGELCAGRGFVNDDFHSNHGCGSCDIWSRRQELLTKDE